MKTRILEQESFDHLFVKWCVDTSGDSTVTKYHLYTREFSQYFFEFMEILRTISYPSGRNIIVYRNWQIVVICELKNRIEGFIVNARHISVGKESEVIVPEKNLSDATPNIWIESIHSFYVFDGMFVSRIESTNKWVDAFLILWREIFVLFCNDRIGRTIVVTFTIIIEVVFWCFAFIFGPLLGNRKSKNYCLLYIGLIHVDDQILESWCFLEKVDRMNMSIDHRVPRSSKRLKSSVSCLNYVFYLSII